MTPPVPTPRFSCLCGEPYMIAALDPATEARALDEHACGCERPTLPIFDPATPKAVLWLAAGAMVGALVVLGVAAWWLGVAQ